MGFSKKLTTDTPQSPGTTGTGNWGEKVAAQYLMAKGYAITEMNWRCGHLEVDLIACKDTRIVFIEVKTRKNGDIDPLDSVTPAKQKRIIRSAQTYMQQFNIPLEYQFDIVTVIGTETDFKISHFPDAFFPSIRH